MTFRCTACTARLHVPKRWAGTTIACPKCTTRVVVPLESPDSRPPVRFEDRSLEKRIEAFELATVAAVNQAAAMADGKDRNDSGPKDAEMHEREFGRRTIAIPSGWIPLLVAGVLVAIAAAAAAGFWAGWLASQHAANEPMLDSSTRS